MTGRGEVFSDQLSRDACPAAAVGCEFARDDPKSCRNVGRSLIFSLANARVAHEDRGGRGLGLFLRAVTPSGGLNFSQRSEHELDPSDRVLSVSLERRLCAG